MNAGWLGNPDQPVFFFGRELAQHAFQEPAALRHAFRIDAMGQTGPQ